MKMSTLQIDDSSISSRHPYYNISIPQIAKQCSSLNMVSSGNKRTGEPMLPCICCPSTSSTVPVCVKRRKLTDKVDPCEAQLMDTTGSDMFEVMSMDTVGSDSDSEMKNLKNDREICKLIYENLCHRYIAFENDPNPYELREGYDGTDPMYPDRRWQRRIEDRPATPGDMYPQSMTSGDKVWWLGEVPFPMVIAAEDYSQDKMVDWLNDERELRDDWDAEEEDCVCVSALSESVSDASEISDISTDEEDVVEEW